MFSQCTIMFKYEYMNKITSKIKNIQFELLLSYDLECGVIPARFEIQKRRLMFLQYILQQPPNSLLFRFLKLQLEMPVKGDWGTTICEDIEELNINNSFMEIKSMTKKPV